jgi:hypothetical protein
LRGIAQDSDKSSTIKHEELFIYAPQFFSCDINGDGLNDVIYTTILNFRKSFKQFVAKAFYGTPGGLAASPHGHLQVRIQFKHFAL